MGESTNFGKLVSDLSMDERHNLLSKLKGNSTMSSEALYSEEEIIAPISDIQNQYAKLSWFDHFWYFILSFFKSKPPLKIFEDHVVSTMGAKLDERYPGMYDYQKGLLLAAFCRNLEQLKEAARFFYTALDISVNRDKGAFFSFMGSLEMPNIHKQLQTEMDPLKIIENNPNLQEAELRQIALKSTEITLTEISDEQREAMYFNARSLNCLKELSSFLFDRIIMAFSNKGAASGEVCPASSVRDLLTTLNNILISLKDVPPMALLESLFVFTLQEKAGEQGFDIHREIRLLLAKAENALGVIRDFNQKVPLTWIIRCNSRDMSYAPWVISGGEDWFVVYRDYRKQQIDSVLKNYIRERNHKELLSSFGSFLKGAKPEPLENVQSDETPDGIPVKGAFALSFLRSFYSAVFMPEINKYLRPILINGIFHEKESRAEFAESYNNFMKLEDDINKLEWEISLSGDYGKRYQQVRQEMTSLPVKRRKTQIVLEDVSGDVSKILERTKEASRKMIKIIAGVLGKDGRNKQYAMTNLNKVIGKDTMFIEGLEETSRQLQRILKIMEDMDAIESGY